MPDGAPPLIDWEQLDMIADGYTDDFIEIYREFVVDLPRVLGELRKALDDGDSNQVGRTAHQAKGSAANFGFIGVTACMSEIETAARAGSTAGAAEQLSAAESAFLLSLKEIKDQRGI